MTTPTEVRTTEPATTQPDPEPTTAPTSGPPETTAPTPTEPVATEPVATEPARLIGLVGTVIDIDYYGACGNETFDLDGVTWYPLQPDEQEEIDEGDYAAIESITEPAGLLRVAPPGPGDDAGTLFQFADGLGRFVSDSGDVDVWMTTDERTYDVVC